MLLSASGCGLGLVSRYGTYSSFSAAANPSRTVRAQNWSAIFRSETPRANTPLGLGSLSPTGLDPAGGSTELAELVTARLKPEEPLQAQPDPFPEQLESSHLTGQSTCSPAETPPGLPWVPHWRHGPMRDGGATECNNQGSACHLRR